MPRAHDPAIDTADVSVRAEHPTAEADGRAISLQALLLRLILFAFVPVFLASASLIYKLVEGQRDELGQSVLDNARSLSAVIDGELAQWRAVAETLARVAELDPFDPAAVHAAARQISADRPGSRIVLVDSDGRQLFSTLQPFGTPLQPIFGDGAPDAGPPDPNVEDWLKVFASGLPVLSNVFTGASTGLPSVAYRVPVRREGRVRFALAIAFPPDRLSLLLARERGPADWFAAVTDRRGIIAARSLAPERFVGRPASAEFVARSAADRSGLYRGASLEGTPVITAFHRSDETGWVLGAAAPVGAAEEPVRRSLAVWSAVMACLVGLAIALARQTWHEVAKPLRTLAANAEAFEKGQEILLPQSNVREIRDCGRAWSLAIEADRARRSQERLRMAAEARQLEIEQASREKDRVLAALGHELRNPLGAISNSVQVLEATMPAQPRAKAMIGIISRQSAHLGHLVDNLLDLARATFGKMQIDRAPLDLLRLVHQTVSAYAPLARTIPALQVGGGPVWVDGDATRLEQVIRNLVDNAIKFTPPEGRITIRVRAVERRAVLEIADTGAGIPPALADTLFDPFVQNEQTIERAQGGLGLGLALVRQIVELHGGTVSASSDGVDRGTRVTVSLPSCARPPRATAPPPTGAGLVGAPRQRVLVVEDQDDFRASLVTLLELMDQEARSAADGRTALAMLTDWIPDVMMVDLGLPDMDGFAFAQKVREQSRLAGVRLYAVSGYSQPADQARALQVGFDRFIAKPVSAEVLRELLRAPA